MRRLLGFVLGTLTMFIGTCVPEQESELGYGHSANWLGDVPFCKSVEGTAFFIPEEMRDLVEYDLKHIVR